MCFLDSLDVTINDILDFPRNQFCSKLENVGILKSASVWKYVNDGKADPVVSASGPNCIGDWLQLPETETTTITKLIEHNI